jgi:hypothetical protein
MGTDKGIGALTLECPQGHHVGTVLKKVEHAPIEYAPPPGIGPWRPWPQEHEQESFKQQCRACDRPVGDATATLQRKLGEVLADEFETNGEATLPYVNAD